MKVWLTPDRVEFGFRRYSDVLDIAVGCAHIRIKQNEDLGPMPAAPRWHMEAPQGRTHPWRQQQVFGVRVGGGRYSYSLGNYDSPWYG